MTYTEEEAEMLWCPQARMLSHTSAQDGKGRIFEGGYSYNRSPDEQEYYIPTGAYCIGSKCAMWRWASKPNPDWSPSMSQMQWPQKDTRNDPPMYIDDTTRGYCGLAGRS